MGRRCSSDPALLWLWHRLAATALIRPLAWEPPYATGAAQEMAKKTKKKERKCGLNLGIDYGKENSTFSVEKPGEDWPARSQLSSVISCVDGLYL